MATKRKRTSKPNTAAAPATDASKPGASGRVAPRKRTDVPPAKPKPRAAGTPHVEENEGQTPLEQTSRAAKVRAKAAARLKEDAAAIVDDAAKEDGAEASTEAERGKRRRERAEAKPRKKRWPLVVAGSVLLVVLLIVGGFSWDRWLRYDDAAEFQGEWQTHGTTAVVVIDGETIKLTEDVSWSYTLDTDAKTISYTFGNMEGSGRYRFSLDQLVRAIQGQPQEEPQSGAGCTVLDRLSHDAEATPQRGEPVAPEPEPEPAAEPEPEAAPEPDPGDRQKPESDSASGPEDASASEAADEGGSASDAADKNDDAAASGTRGVFDVSDLPA